MVNKENEEAARKLRKLGERLRMALDPLSGRDISIKLEGSATNPPPPKIRTFASNSDVRSGVPKRRAVKTTTKSAKQKIAKPKNQGKT